MSAPLGPGAAVEGYRLHAPLGAGAAADVFLAHDAAGERFALKLLRTHNARTLARMEREASVLRALRHPHVVRLHDTVHHDGRLGLVLELVDGLDLACLIRRYNPSLAQVDDLAAQLFDGLSAVHHAGLVHRDLKPANILVDLQDRVTVKLGDFGLARDTEAVRSPRLTWSGAPVGTPSHMAPEQQRAGRHADARSDLFALGTVLYELLTGRTPFDGTDTAEVFAAVAEGRYLRLERAKPNLPGRMVSAVTAALQTRPADRPEGVDALAALWWSGAERPPRGHVWEPHHLAELHRLALIAPSPRTDTMSAPPAAARLLAPPDRPTTIRRPAERSTVPARPPLPPKALEDRREVHPLWWTFGGAFGGVTVAAVGTGIVLFLAVVAWFVAGVR